MNAVEIRNLSKNFGAKQAVSGLDMTVPMGPPEIDSPADACTVKIVTDQKTEEYSGCRWVTVRREFSKQGLRRIRKGIALQREEV